MFYMGNKAPNNKMENYEPKSNKQFISNVNILNRNERNSRRQVSRDQRSIDDDEIFKEEIENSPRFDKSNTENYQGRLSMNRSLDYPISNQFLTLLISKKGNERIQLPRLLACSGE